LTNPRIKIEKLECKISQILYLDIDFPMLKIPVQNFDEEIPIKMQIEGAMRWWGQRGR